MDVFSFGFQLSWVGFRFSVQIVYCHLSPTLLSREAWVRGVRVQGSAECSNVEDPGAPGTKRRASARYQLSTVHYPNGSHHRNSLEMWSLCEQIAG
jgi:hypothetical protein